MKKITLFIYLLLVFSSRSQAQTLTQFWSDTFEDKGAPSSGTRTPENNAGTSPTPFASYFVRTDDKGIYLEKDYSGFQGAKFWAGENHSGAFGIGNEEQQIDFKGIDITGKTGLTFKCLFAANSTSKAWENQHYKSSPSKTTDYVYVEYSVDGGAYEPLIKFFGNNGTTKNLAEDTGVDSIGDGVELTAAFKEFSKKIATTGNNIDIRIRASSNDFNEEWAIDNFRLFESPPCNLTVTASNVSNVSCNDGDDGKAAVVIAGAEGAVTYNWTPGKPTGYATASVKGLAAGTYSCTVKDATGCAKTVEIVLTQPAAISITQAITICTGKSIKIGTKTYTTSGHYKDVVKSWTGCDSTIITDLTVTPAITTTQNITLCAGKSVKVGANTYTTTGTFTDKLKTKEGCDSTVTTKLTVLKAIATAQSFALCNGQTVVVGTHTYSKPGKYTDVLVANNMCDSTVTTTITLGKAVALAQTKAICSGGSVLVGNHIYTKKGVYKDTLTTKGGCDSVVTTTVTIVKALATSQQFTICSGKSITVGTHTYTKAGTYVDSLKADAGCDSIVTTKVALLPVAMGSQQFTLCEGQTVVVGNHIYSVSGTYKDTLQTKGGCDSILATILKINPSIKAAQKITICEGNRLIIGAHIYSTTGVYKDTLTTTKGCDSILTTTLTVNAAPKVSLNLNSIDTVCLKGGSVKLSGGLPTGGIYEGQSVTSSVFNPLTAGVGVHVITYSYTNSLGCEGNAKATILVDVCLSIENRSAKQVLNVYPNPHDENFTLEFEVAKSAVFTIKLVNVLGETVKEIENSFLSGVYKNEISTKDLPNGMYFITVQSADMKSVKRVVKN